MAGTGQRRSWFPAVDRLSERVNAAAAASGRPVPTPFEAAVRGDNPGYRLPWHDALLQLSASLLILLAQLLGAYDDLTSDRLLRLLWFVLALVAVFTAVLQLRSMVTKLVLCLAVVVGLAVWVHAAAYGLVLVAAGPALWLGHRLRWWRYQRSRRSSPSVLHDGGAVPASADPQRETSPNEVAHDDAATVETAARMLGRAYLTSRSLWVVILSGDVLLVAVLAALGSSLAGIVGPALVLTVVTAAMQPFFVRRTVRDAMGSPYARLYYQETEEASAGVLLLQDFRGRAEPGDLMVQVVGARPRGRGTARRLGASVLAQLRVEGVRVSVAAVPWRVGTWRRRGFVDDGRTPIRTRMLTTPTRDGADGVPSG